MSTEVEDITQKYYKRLFILPVWWKLIALFLGLLAIVGFIDSSNPLMPASIIKSIDQYLIIGFAAFLSFLPLALGKLFNAKRVLGLATAIFIASLPAELIFFRLTGLRGTGLLAGAGFIYIVLTAFYSPLIALAISSVMTFTAFSTANSVLGVLTHKAIIGGLLTEMISILGGNIFLSYLEWEGRRFGGFSPVWLARSFIKTWFTEEPESLEEVFLRFGNKIDVRVKALAIIRHLKKKVALIFPSIHYGPFRNVGSSRFIYQLENYIEPEIKVLTFHTAGSHEHNVSTSEESDKIAKEISDFIKGSLKGNHTEELMCKPYRITFSNGWNAFVINTPSFISIFLVNKSEGNDDLPHELWDYIEDKVSEAKIIAAVADSHSFKGPRITELNKVKDIVDRALRAYDCNKGMEFRAGYGEAISKKICRGMCNNKVKVISLSFKGERYGIIYIYGNNMERKYRLKLESLAKKLGYTDVEVITPDDHSCAASFKEAPYDLVQECEPLTQAVGEALNKATMDEVPAKAVPLETVIKGVSVAGEKIFEFMNALPVLVPKLELGSLIFYIVINALPTILYLMIFA